MKTLVDVMDPDDGDRRAASLGALQELVELAMRRRGKQLAEGGDLVAQALVVATSKMLSTPKHTWEQAFYSGLLTFLTVVGASDDIAMETFCIHRVMDKTHRHSAGELASNLRAWVEFHGLDIFRPQ